MCGINGILSKTQINTNLIKLMNDSIYHRGPDDEGNYRHTNKDFSISMGMRRLSIIDLKKGKQPMYSDDESIIIVFNGEIYNFLEIKSQLTENGVKFKTNSDTEVILKLYENYGIDSIDKLDGMYSFAITDLNKSKLYIARDFFGEKPLYYTNLENKFIWASELKSIIKVLNKKPNISFKGLSLFFQLTYIPSPYTIYENIHKLQPSSYLEVDLKSKKFIIKAVENNENDYDGLSFNFNQAKKVTHDLIFDSVKSRSISDVDIGTFLSGGVDSSIISFCLSKLHSDKINSFSIGFENQNFDETDKSDIVSRIINSNHNKFIISEKDLSVNIDKIILNFDEPFADSSSIPTYIVSNLTGKSLKVALTGDGGDEVFGGYNKYYMGALNKKYTSLFPKIIHNNLQRIYSKLISVKNDSRGFSYKLKRFLDSIDYENNFYSNIISLGFNFDSLKDLFVFNSSNFFSVKNLQKFSVDDTLHDFRKLDRMISLEGDMLVKVDRTSMLNSLECRAPFLNKKIWNFTERLNENFLINKWNKKYILKEAFKNYFPDGFLDKQKQGFGVPVGNWLRSIFKSELLSYCDKKFIIKQGLFNHEYLFKIIDDHISGKQDYTFKLWAFFCFQKWYKFTYEKEIS